MTWRVGPSVLSLVAAGAIGLTIAGGGDPPITNATFDIVLETAPIAVAPHPQWFGVTNFVGFAPAAPVSGGEVYDPRAHDITYIWTFGDAGAVPNAAVNLPTAWRDTNTAYGKRVAHVFGSPGTFTVTCWAYDTSGNLGSATAQVVIQDPATYFTGNRTICLNPAGDSVFTDAPGGSQQFNSWASVQSAMQSLNQPCRVLLKRGALYPDVASWNWASNQNNAYLGDYGTGELPRLRPVETSTGTMLSQSVLVTCDSNKFVNLDLHGWWDAESETGRDSQPVGTFENQNNVLYHGCRLRGWAALVQGGYATFPLDAVVSNCLFEGWRGFGMFVQGGELASARFALVGTAIHQSADCLQGHVDGILGHNLGNTNGPFRCGHITQAFFSCTSMFSNTGGTGADNGGLDPAVDPKVAIQQPFRTQSDQASDYNAAVSILWNVERCVFEGGFHGITLSGTFGAYPGNYVLDKLIILATSQSYDPAIVCNVGGATIRNVFSWLPNTPMTHGARPGVLRVGADEHQATNINRPVRIYGNTFYSARTTANATAGNGNNGNITGLIDNINEVAFNDIVIGNNVLHCPAQDVPITTSAPVDLVAIPGLTTLYRGPRWNFNPINQVLGADVVVGGTVTFAYPNDTATHPAGQATNQAYFLTPPGNNQHQLAEHGLGGNLCSWLGDFSVTFGASNITVTNTSSGTWPAGQNIWLLLDRRNSIPANVAAYANPATVHIPSLLASSPALGGVVGGNVPFDDIYGRQRGTPPSWGALEVNLA